ncbi:type II secretion system protein [Rhodocyclus tenuis]|uniref:Type II secretory pathway pseudopilin PulG n=1 Tax=Rhodocyclus tenuis TaxID=1066 RepID=A0A840GES6_RHOTE|nr:type II secretion system protein [Rhodocyclus tenuis]MBB4249138.1 type II secretory pathway pseudopilin PulG [Rhodocyclus tenuis]
MRPSKRGRDQQGFAYVWILLTVALLAIGLGVVLEVDATAERREKEMQLLAVGEEFRAAIESYYRAPSVAGASEYPPRLEDLLEDRRTGVLRRHLRKIYPDPMTGKAEWGLVRVSGGIVAVHSLSDRAPLRKRGFSDGDHLRAASKSYREWLFGPSG